MAMYTIAIKPGPFAMIDWFGTPQTAALHVVERYRLLDYDEAKEGIQRDFKDNPIAVVVGDPPVVDLNYHGKWLQLLFPVDDPNVFTTPWSATVTYGPQVPPALKGFSLWPEDVCAENPHKYGTEEDVQVPTAKVRSEEHTSELQSPDHLVCRLLLEKKKTKHTKVSSAIN